MKDYRYRYSIEMRIARGAMTLAGWRVGRQGQIRGLGQPTDRNLAVYVRDYNASLAPGGVNAHLGGSARAHFAQVVDHDLDRRVVAEWRAPAFEVIEALAAQGPLSSKQMRSR